MTALDMLIVATFAAAFMGIWEHERDNATSLYHRVTRRVRKRLARRRRWA